MVKIAGIRLRFLIATRKGGVSNTILHKGRNRKSKANGFVNLLAKL